MSRPIARAQAWWTLAALALVWGSSYILIKKSLVSLEAWQVGCLRITLAGLAFMPFAWRDCRRLSAKQWGTVALVGVFGTGLPSFLFPLAQRELSSSMAAALSSLTPLMTTVLAATAFGLTVSRWRIVGILVGLGGALLLVSARYGLPQFESGVGAGTWPMGAVALAIGATLSYAISSNIVKRYTADLPSLTVTAGALVPLSLFGAVGIWIGGGLPIDTGGEGTALVGPLLGSYLAVGFLALVGTALASWLFFRLIQLTDPVFASTVSYLVPGIALQWGLLDGEAITLAMVGAVMVVLAGVYLAKR